MGKRTNKLAQIRRHFALHDVMFIQESHLCATREYDFEKNFEEGTHVFYDHGGRGWGGGVIVIKKSSELLQGGRIITPFVCVNGRSHGINISSSRVNVTLHNVYLSPYDPITKLQDMEQWMVKIPAAGHQIWGGDFNFVIEKEGRMIDLHSQVKLTGKCDSRVLNFFKENIVPKFGIQEVIGPNKIPTFRHSADGSLARLDRFYSHCTVADCVDTNLDIVLPFTKKLTYFSDHRPIGFYVAPKYGCGIGSNPCPRWLTQHKDFPNAVRIIHDYEGYDDRGSVISRLNQLDETFIAAAKVIRKSSKVAVSNISDKLAVASALWGAIKTGKSFEVIESYSKAYPYLGRFTVCNFDGGFLSFCRS